MSEFCVLRLISGNDIVDLLSPPYTLLEDSWSPQVASLDVNRLGGKGSYVDVEEEIAIDVNAASDTELYTDGVDPLIKLLNRADQWGQSKPVEPVILEVQVANSLLADAQQCLIVGRTGNSLLHLPVSFNDYLMVYQIEGASVTFRRRGQWLGATESASSSATTGNPQIVTVGSFAALDVPAPTKICLKNFSASTPMLGEGFFLMTSAPVDSVNGTNFGIWNYAALVGANFSDTADTAKNALGDNVRRIDASSVQSGTLTVSDVNAAVETLSIFAAVRNNTSGTTWRIRARSTGFIEDATRWQVVSDDDQLPHILSLGTVRSAAEFHTNLLIDVETDASSGTLDINYIASLPHNDDTFVMGIFADDYSSSAFPRNLVIDPRPLTHRRGLVYVETEV